MNLPIINADPKRKAQRLTALPSIKLYLHCTVCLEAKPDGVSPKEWSQVQVGFTDVGIQIWCDRHDINVAHIDFEGKIHQANCEPAP